MNQERIGRFIAQNRKKKKMTQEELAIKLGVNSKSVSRWENGKCMPDLSLIKDLCRELDITVNDFLSGEKIDDKDYREKLEENILDLTQYTEKNKKKNKKRIIINIFILLLLFITLLLIINSLDGVGFSFVNIDEYIVSKRLNNRINKGDFDYFVKRINYDYMYELYEEFNVKYDIREDNQVILDKSELMTFQEYKDFILRELKETLKKVKLNSLKHIDGYGSMFFNDTQKVNVQYGINPEDIINYSFDWRFIEIRFSYFVNNESEIKGYNYLPSIYLDRNLKDNK